MPIPQPAESAEDVGANQRSLSDGFSASREYEAAQLSNTVRLNRGGTALVFLLQFSYLIVDSYRHQGPAIAIDGWCVLVAIVAFATTYTEWFKRNWRMLALGTCTIEVVAAAIAAVVGSDPVRTVVTIILYSCGSASLVPWSPAWQQTLNVFCVLALAIQSRSIPAENYARTDMWIAMLVAVGIGQFATRFGERHRRQLRDSAASLDGTHRKLRDEATLRDHFVHLQADAQEKLRDSERRFEQFMRRMPGPAFIRNSDGKYIFVNDKMVTRFAASAQEMLGKGYDDMKGLSPRELAVIKDLDRQILESGEAVQVIETLGGPPVRHWMVHKFPIPDETGKTTMIGGISLDITARVAAEAALKESEQRFRMMVEEVRDYAIFMFDPNGVVMSWNSGAERIYGYQASEIIGQSFAVFYSERDRQNGLPERESGIAAERGRFEEVGQRIRKDGSEFTANVVTTALRNESGTLLGFVKITHDDTERRRAEQERLQLVREQEARVQAEQAVAARDEFLAVLSHELRNPLGAISNALSVIQKVRSNIDLSSRAQEVIARQTFNLTRLVNDLLDLSRVTSGKIKLERRPTDVRQTIEKSVQALAAPAAARDSHIEVSAPRDPILADADPVRLEQIVTNLLDNAIKYTNPGGRIHIEVRVDAPYAIISISDDGIGIKPAMISRIFNPFAQGEGGMVRGAQGLGLGLAIVKRLVEQHGGEISAQSAGAGLGSTFVISLPLASGVVAEPATADLSQIESGRLIVVADDDPDSLASLRDLLELRGHRVIAAHDGPGAVAEILKNRPTVAILDISMPGLTGLEVAARVRAQPWAGSMLLIALTGHGFAADRTRSLAAGFDVHLEKPTDITELSRLIRVHGVEPPRSTEKATG